MVVQRMLQSVQRSLFQVGIWLADKREIDGMVVVQSSDRVDSKDMYVAVEAALDLLRTYDPRRYGNTKRYMSRMVVAPQPTTEYWRHARACALSDRSLATQPPEWIASVIVHESVHARIHCRGFDRGQVDVARVEALCVKEQIRFLETVPGTEQFIEHLKSELEQGEWFLPEARKQRVLDRLNALEAPPWIIRWMERRSFGP